MLKKKERNTPALCSLLARSTCAPASCEVCKDLSEILWFVPFLKDSSPHWGQGELAGFPPQVPTVPESFSSVGLRQAPWWDTGKPQLLGTRVPLSPPCLSRSAGGRRRAHRRRGPPQGSARASRGGRSGALGVEPLGSLGCAPAASQTCLVPSGRLRPKRQNDLCSPRVLPTSVQTPFPAESPLAGGAPRVALREGGEVCQGVGRGSWGRNPSGRSEKTATFPESRRRPEAGATPFG